MGYSTRKILIGSSSVLALLLIGTAYATSGPLPFKTSTAGAESTHDILVSYASKDTDADGLPDWQEALYGTDPTNPHSVNPSATDAEAVAQGLVKPKFATATSTPVDTSIIPGVQAGPTTVTDQFAKSLFGQYLKTRGANQPTSPEIAAFVEQGFAQLKESQTLPDTFNQGQVKVSGTGPDALLVYAAAAEAIVLKVDSGKDRDEVSYFYDAINKDDKKSLAKVKEYADAYKNAGMSLMKITVPKELSSNHLLLANSLVHVGESLESMSVVTSDPIRTMLGIASYSSYTESGRSALAKMNAVFNAEHALPPSNTPGAVFYALTLAANKK